TLLDALENKDYPFSSMVREARVPRGASRLPLVDVIFICDRTAEQKPWFGCDVSMISAPLKAAVFDLNLNLTERRTDLLAELQANQDLFHPDTIAAMLENYRVLLRSAAQNPHLPIAELDLLSETEKHQVVNGWNQTDRIHENSLLVHQAFELQAQQTPNVVAAIFEQQSLTYQELDQRANLLADYLTKFGVGPEVVVGLCVERSLDMLVGLLGILKAGGAYVPLDPSFPRDRLGHMVEDSGMRVLIT